MSKSKQYFCFLQYFATGEGLTENMAFVDAKSEKEAIKIFCRDYVLSKNTCTLEEEVSFFSDVVCIYDLSKKESRANAQEILNNFFRPEVTRSILKARMKKNAIFDFNFRFYANYS